MVEKRARKKTAKITPKTTVVPLSRADDASLPVLAKLTEETANTNQKTAKRAAQILVALDIGYIVPTRKQRKALLVAFAQEGQVVYGRAFDIVRCPRDLDLDDSKAIARHLDDVLICEIKSTNSRSVKPDFSGYFFAITGGEMLTSQSLGAQYRFVFVNTLTRDHVELSLQQIFARTRGIYPTWSIRI